MALFQGLELLKFAQLKAHDNEKDRPHKAVNPKPQTASPNPKPKEESLDQGFFGFLNCRAFHGVIWGSRDEDLGFCGWVVGNICGYHLKNSESSGREWKHELMEAEST